MASSAKSSPSHPLSSVRLDDPAPCATNDQQSKGRPKKSALPSGPCLICLRDALNPQAKAPARQQLPCLQASRASSPGQCRRPALPRLPTETGTATNASAERKRGRRRGANPPDLTGKAPQGPRPVMTRILGTRGSGTRGAGSLGESAISRG